MLRIEWCFDLDIVRYKFPGPWKNMFLHIFYKFWKINDRVNKINSES